ncbi:MAG: D-cysteine desulfhydrase [Myxococcota bacterium]|jgi:D-cysteine desulfhydrase
MKPLALSRLPTPLQHLPGPSKRLGAEIWVKRDDLTGLGLSGNKVRKLDYLLSEAQSAGSTCVITTGGLQSNHCRATAVAARMIGLRPVLLLRGAPPTAAADGNLLLDTILGADITFITPEQYAHRDALMAEAAERLVAQGERPYIIPEGGSSAVGALGFVQAGRELAVQAVAAGVDFDTVLCAVGSGGTLAGLAMSGLSASVLGVAVCDDRAYFRQRVEEIADDASRLGLSLPPRGWDVLEGFAGRGYALSSPAELSSQITLARETGLILDPVYTGKAWHALEQTLAGSPRALGRRILFWHTGGLFGIFGRGQEYADAE